MAKYKNVMQKNNHNIILFILNGLVMPFEL